MRGIAPVSAFSLLSLSFSACIGVHEGALARCRIESTEGSAEQRSCEHGIRIADEEMGVRFKDASALQILVESPQSRALKALWSAQQRCMREDALPETCRKSVDSYAIAQAYEAGRRNGIENADCAKK
jgi:hypothetical protein